MKYKQLYIFVEGNDDERFFKTQIKPLFENKYQNIKFLKIKLQNIV